MIQNVNEPKAAFDYDNFLKDVMGIPPREMPSWIPCRSVEEAEAFAAWCIENGIEEPEIIVRKHKLSPVL